MPIKLNLGCGSVKIDGFINIDHRGCVADVVDDAFTLTGYEEGSVSEIVAAHILEHAQFDRTAQILKRWYSLLARGGMLWVAVPNFEMVVNEHHKNYKAGKTSWEFFNSRIFGNAKAARAMYGTKELKAAPGILAYELAFHRAVFTPAMLVNCVKRAGFKTVKLKGKLPYKKAHPCEVCVVGVR